MVREFEKEEVDNINITYLFFFVTYPFTMMVYILLFMVNHTDYITYEFDFLTFNIVVVMIHLYKNQLQNYAQKRNLSLPEYAPEWEGPPHAMRFGCKVTIDGHTFQSPKFYSTLKEAEHAAAEIAFKSLSPNGVQEVSITHLWPIR